MYVCMCVHMYMHMQVKSAHRSIIALYVFVVVYALPYMCDVHFSVYSVVMARLS